MSEKAFEEWANLYQGLATQGSGFMAPSETLVRLFKGNYIPDLVKSYEGKKALEVGFGAGSNLIFLASLGLEVSGTEVDLSICELVRDKLAKLGRSVDLRVGTNRALPFPDGEFDFIVSWNVIHYEPQESDMEQAISEYARVLKPGGRFFLSTTGPEDKILCDSSTLGMHRYRIGREDDFRKGQVYFYFDAPQYIEYYFSRHFNNIMVGRIRDFLMTEMLDFFIATGVKA